MNELFRGFGIEIELVDDESFLKVIETLERIGIASNDKKILWQSCHILHKQGHYAILHFKEMFGLDNREITFSTEDEKRRNRITLLLESWNLIKIKNKSKLIPHENIFIKILKYEEKKDWQLKPKYKIGNK